MERPSPLTYSSLLEWLKDLVVFFHEEKKWSLREFSRRADFASGYMPMVLAGKRRLSYKALEKIIQIAEFTEVEKNSLRDLFSVSESPAEQERASALLRLQERSGSGDKLAPEHEVYRYLSEELLVTLREMTFLKGAPLDPLWFRSKLRKHYTLPQIKKAFEDLEKMGFVQRVGKRWVSTQKDLSCSDGVYSISLGVFHNKMLELIKESVKTLSRDERHLEGYTFALTKKKYVQAVELMQETVSKLKKLEAQPGDGEEVYHFEAALVPLTHGTSKKFRKEESV